MKDKSHLRILEICRLAITLYRVSVINSTVLRKGGLTVSVSLKKISYANYVKARDAKGLNNLQVANLAQIPSSTIYDWAAERYMPKTDKLLAIAKVLDVSVEKLLEE